MDIDIYGAFHYIISYTSKNKYNAMHYLLFNEHQIYDHIEFHIFVYYWNDIHCDNIYCVFVIKFIPIMAPCTSTWQPYLLTQMFTSHLSQDHFKDFEFKGMGRGFFYIINMPNLLIIIDFNRC